MTEMTDKPQPRSGAAQPAHYPSPRNAPYGLDWPPEDVPPFNGKPVPAPHRATIALIPHCPNGFCPFWMVEVDSEAVFIGTEAEAKAKMESLRGHE